MDHYKIFFKGTMASAIALSLTLAATTAQAALVDVGGVIWDPNWVDDTDEDFQATSDFRQWFQTTNDGIDTNALVGFNLDNANSAAFDNYLFGVGKMNNVNAANDITGQPLPETNPANFCPGCEVTYEFGGIQLVENDPGDGDISDNSTFTINLNDAYWNVWVDTNRDFNVNSISSINNATNGDLFLTGSFEDFNLASSGIETELSGNAILGGNVQALLSVSGGLAAAYFDTNTFTNGPSDLFYTASTQFNLDTTDTFYSGVATGEFQGDTVAIPEPHMLALLGLGLLGLGAGAAQRRHNKSKS